LACRRALASLLLQRVDPSEKLADEHSTGVIEAEIASQPHRSREQWRVLGTKQRRRGAPAGGLHEPECHEPAHHIWV